VDELAERRVEREALDACPRSDGGITQGSVVVRRGAQSGERRGGQRRAPASLDRKQSTSSVAAPYMQ